MEKDVQRTLGGGNKFFSYNWVKSMIEGSGIIKNRLTQNQAIILNVMLIGLKEIYSIHCRALN